ncbi:ribosomal RNA small subunit methyltransferase I [Catellatospora sp. IY07-71]|uniref:16S rRNA (cytidine(1402)-2'-O)-methyltransferase n=1 Tax=Catellatospora sp. IY07-71 TaxID=2728827 RepID=UPI001BB42C3A|nr:16S rRNA (cytidine(1402)-2'-O)-methyltransferase [Catellatospora sp. IY07-71]BCJ72247.1 ribosomal RNA small subunit methyltransferase I [Catellatospora sp. IY07-71]
MAETGGLVLCGAPLGNPADASQRLRAVLAEADLVAAEDTRRLLRLAKDLDVAVGGRIVSYFEGNEERRTPELVEAMREGQRVALVTDGGMPSVSDPGYRLVAAALAAGLPVTCAPGPSAVTTALALSGLPCDRFCFEGFLPRKGGERRARLAALATEERTLVLFESTHRIADTLADLVAAFGGDRRAALCRELTKTYEEIRRATLAELTETDEFRGELTLVIAGATPTPATRPTDETLLAEIESHIAAGLSRRDAATAVATAHNLPRRDIYPLTTRR